MADWRALPHHLRRALRRRVGLGPFRSTVPVSADFGYARGLPVDRFYIEQFLAASAPHIRGTTLEVGDDSYTARFGGPAATRREVIHIDAPAATYRGDMTQPGVLPPGRFDCAVITQTLHLIYDMPAAIGRLRDAMATGGTLLLTVPGITPIAGDRWGETWWWSLTPLSLARLLGDAFGAENVAIEAYGNVFAATALLQGLAVEDLDPSLLAPYDKRYPVIVAATARRPAG